MKICALTICTFYEVRVIPKTKIPKNLENLWEGLKPLAPPLPFFGSVGRKLAVHQHLRHITYPKTALSRTCSHIKPLKATLSHTLHHILTHLQPHQALKNHTLTHFTPSYLPKALTTDTPTPHHPPKTLTTGTSTPYNTSKPPTTSHFTPPTTLKTLAVIRLRLIVKKCNNFITKHLKSKLKSFKMIM